MIVAFSGGVESTALLQYLKDKGQNVVAIYSHFPNSNTQAKQVPEHIQKICDLLDVELIIHTHQDYGLRRTQYFYSTRHWILAMCNASLRFPNQKNFYWGANSGLVEFNDGLGDCSIVDPTKYQVQNIFESRLFQRCHVICQRNTELIQVNGRQWRFVIKDSGS